MLKESDNTAKIRSRATIRGNCGASKALDEVFDDKISSLWFHWCQFRAGRLTWGNGCIRTEKWDKENALGFGYMEREVREDSATVD